jgi:hypothetical protein
MRVRRWLTWEKAFLRKTSSFLLAQAFLSLCFRRWNVYLGVYRRGVLLGVCIVILLMLIPLV